MEETNINIPILSRVYTSFRLACPPLEGHGIQFLIRYSWIPAYAGMTAREANHRVDEKRTG